MGAAREADGVGLAGRGREGGRLDRPGDGITIEWK